ncbi:hypothetical protein LCGC14_0392160 [marine sediment metagenome]|uniref:DNA methylase N-4/N-6 domain-containing protein n=1 Tax=marine sediment metagenome TaxID=412755 RepID=A0A0F9THB9_9ZZZZ
MKIKRSKIKLVRGDCLKLMPNIPAGSIDMVCADPPYGTTACKWDSIIPLDLMWEQLRQVVKPNAAIVMTASQPFTSVLTLSNVKMFKYCWVWDKPAARGHFNAKKMPMRAHEDIVVFYEKQCVYIPQMTKGHGRVRALKNKKNNSDVYNDNTKTTNYDSTQRYPRSIQTIKQEPQTHRVHPTQKPVALMEYLIKTYTNPGDTVLDFAMGSGTTGVACKNLGRRFIGIELDKTYFEIAKDRIHGST